MQVLRKSFNLRKRKTEKNTLTMKEEIQCFLEGAGIVVIFSYFFYRSYVALLFLSPLFFFYRKYKKKQILRLRIENLEQQFKETILSVQTNLQAGYSIENAFIESYQDIVRIYGESSAMGEELQIIRKGLNNGNTLENLLMELGRKCPDSEIEEFAKVYAIACKTGNQWN